MTKHQKIKPDAPQTVGTVQLKKIGNSTGVLLPKDLMARLNLQVGDKFYATFTPDGGIRLTPHDPDFEQGMKVARKGMAIYRNALAELAK